MSIKIHKHIYQVKLFKVLANSNRLRVLELLLSNKKPMTVNVIADELNIGQGNLSSHLIKMREAGVVSAQQDGLNMHYSVKDENVAKVLRSLKLK